MIVSLSRRRLLAGLALGLPAISAAKAQAPNPLAGRFGGPFSLVDHTGKRVTEADFKGRFVLIYFGFTTCTDVCPIDLPLLMGAIDRLGPRADVLQPLFISVDPRDTPAIMKPFVEAYHPRLVGLTGTEAELAAAARSFRVHRRKLLLPEAGTGSSPAGNAHAGHQHNQHAHASHPYTIDHGSLAYLLDPQGNFLTLIPHNTPMDRIVAVLGKYLPARG